MPMDTEKTVIIEEINQKHKAATMSTDTWIQSQAQARTQMEKHNEMLADLNARQRSMEQHVKQINRVLANQNVEGITETMKMGLDDLRKEMMHALKEKEHTILEHVEADIGNVVDSRAALVKKVNELEERLANTLNTKFEEARKQRNSLRVEFEELKAATNEFPDSILAVKRSVESVDNQLQELKKELRNFKASHDAANVEQDKMLNTMTADLRLAQETAAGKLEMDSKILSNNVNKNMLFLEDKMKAIMPVIEKECQERHDMCKSIFDRLSDKLHEEKLATEQAVHVMDGEVERRVALVSRNVNYVKAVVQEERTLRENAVKELSLSLASEKKQRDLDENRLLNMIHSCTSTLSKLHKAT